MIMNNLELKSIEDLQDMSFYIPAYQRGYRWTTRQVEDLLDDIAEFINNGAKGIYCIQPLVVVERKEGDVIERIKQADDIDTIKKLLKGMWEVVDGQQRLTTIKLIQYGLGMSSYTIEYETRQGSAEYLDQIQSDTVSKDYESNIDYYHMWNAYHAIKRWLGQHQDVDITNVLLKQVKFIWYETNDANPKEVFTRLNIGKISLTNAELVKALLLNKSNFNQYVNDDTYIKALQQEIAMQWDIIEYSLQSREFWLFLNNIGQERATRIELIFFLIAKNDMLHCGYEEGLTETDDFFTFRYFYRFMSKGVESKQSKNEIIKTIWENVMEIYQTLKEWYDDMELYHYIGFLVCCHDPDFLYTLYNEWNKSKFKSEFRSVFLINEIKRCIKNKDVDNTVYEEGGNGGPKTNCRPILLLHNIQTIINQNKVLSQNEKYRAGVFYKFPFHLYKSEGWDIEHIDSNTENRLNDIRSQREWLLNAYFGLRSEDDRAIRNSINAFFLKYQVKNDNDVDRKTERDKDFDTVYKQIVEEKAVIGRQLSQEEKNKLWNFTLLDASTNRSYGNAIYPSKRRVIIGKEQGKKYAPPTIDENGIIIDAQVTEGQSSFIPPCTKYVFMKYYDTKAFDPNTWNRDDAEAYLNDIKETLKQFLL